MFRKKDTTVNTTGGLQKEAQKFQKAVAEINSKYEPSALNIAILEGAASKAGVETSYLRDAFETYLKKNALATVRAIKAGNDYSIINLEQAVEKFGYELDDLNITYFSEE